LARERLTEIDHQVPMLIQRHRQVHHAILLVNTAVVTLVLSMFIIGAAALAESRWGRSRCPCSWPQRPP
jgi:hypothetical protein